MAVNIMKSGHNIGTITCSNSRYDVIVELDTGLSLGSFVSWRDAYAFICSILGCETLLGNIELS